MMKLSSLAAGAAALAVFLAMCGCSPINEGTDHSGGGTAVYIAPQIKEKAVSYGGRYVYESLTAEEKKNYDALLEAVKGFEQEAVFASSLDGEELRRIFTAVYTQESRVFWLDSRYYTAEENPSVSLFYRYSREKSEEMRAELDIAAGKIIGGLPADCSEYEAVKAFHDAIVLGCSFSKEGEYVHTAYGALIEGHAQCEGYAFAMAYLCNMAGIDNYVVTGTDGKGASHAWNKVSVDGEWYNVDCTWDDPLLERKAPGFIRHDYMLVPDSDINGITHFPDEGYVVHIPCTADSMNYFIKEGLCFSDASGGLKALEEQLYRAALAGKTEGEVRFSSAGAYEEASRLLFEEGGFSELIGRLNSNYGLGIYSANNSSSDSIRTIHISLIFDSSEG